MNRLASSTFVGLSALTALLTTAIVVRSHHLDERWQAMVAQGMSQELEFEASQLDRPVLRGESIEGCGLAEYRRAVDSLPAEMLDDWYAYTKLKKSGVEVQCKALRDKMIDSNAEALEALALGARHTRGHAEVQWEPGLPVDCIGLLEGRSLSNLVVLAAERHLERGEAQRATDVLMDGMQFGCDLMRGPTGISHAIGLALLDIACFDALIEKQLVWSLPKSQIQKLQVALEQLDTHFPQTDLLQEAEHALLIRSIVKASKEGRSLAEVCGPLNSSWEDVCSERATVLAEFEKANDWLGRYESAGRLPWDELRDEWESLDQESRGLNNPFLYTFGGKQIGLESGHRKVLMKLRLTRIALDFAIAGQASPLPDPFGGELIVTQTDAGLQIRSLADQEAFLIL